MGFVDARALLAAAASARAAVGAFGAAAARAERRLARAEGVARPSPAERGAGVPVLVLDPASSMYRPALALPDFATEEEGRC